MKVTANEFAARRPLWEVLSQFVFLQIFAINAIVFLQTCELLSLRRVQLIRE